MPIPAGTVSQLAADDRGLHKFVERPLALPGTVPLALGFGIVTFLAPFVFSSDLLAQQLHEDGALEYLQALLLLAGSACFFLTYRLSSSSATIGRISFPRNVFFLALGLVLAFGAGEELSWGQRIVDFDTPRVIADVNVQRELTIHNLVIFDATTNSMLKMDRLFHVFWFVTGIAIPLLDRWSGAASRWMGTSGMPVFPLGLSIQFLVFYLLAKTYVPFGLDPTTFGSRLTELRETQHTLLFALIGLSFVIPALRSRAAIAKPPFVREELAAGQNGRAV